MKIEDVVGKDAPEDIRIAFQHSAFYLKETSEGDVLSVICPPDIANLLKNNSFNLREELKRFAEKKLGKHLAVEVALSDETIETYGQRMEEDKKEKGTIVPSDSGMNPYFTFDSFEVSSCNESAYKTAFLYANTSDHVPYKLLFICGNYGVGKSHLLNAIGNLMYLKGKKVAFFTSATFVDYVVKYTRIKDESVKRKMIDDIKSSDIFLMDDLHLLKSKTVTQEELKFFIDYFFALGKPMAFTSIYGVAELEDMNKMRKEVVSRFHEGMPVYLSPPDYPLKYILLKKYLAERKIKLKDSTISALASVEAKNIREIQSLANMVHSIMSNYKNLTERELFDLLTSKGKIHIPTVEEKDIDKCLKDLGFDNVSANDLKDKRLRYNKEIRTIRNEVIKHLIKSGTYSKADLARMFGLTRASITIILKK